MDRRRVVLGICILLGLMALGLLLWERSNESATDTVPSRTQTPYVPDANLHAGLRGNARDPAEAGSTTDDDPDTNAKPEAGEADPAGAEQGAASLTVETVDGMTGRDVRGYWNLGTGWATNGPFPAGMRVTVEAVERQREAARASKAAWERAFLRTGDPRADVLSRGERLRHPFVLRLPPGYVLDSPNLHILGSIAAGVTQARVVIPVWPEAVLDLTVSDPEGQPATGVLIERIYAAGRLRLAKLETLAPGIYRVRGIPRLAGEALRAVLLWSPRSDEESEEVFEEIEEPEDLDRHCDLSTQSPQIDTVIPTDPALPWHVHVDFSEERHEGIMDSVEFDSDLEWDESGSETGGDDVPMGRVRIRALGWDGHPIVGRKLLGRTTDAEGVIRFERYTPGKATFEMSIPGHLPARATVTVEANKTTEVILREPLGARLKVYVSDAEGRPRPSATLHLGGRRWFDVQAGVQRLDLHANANGRRTLTRVQPGKFKLRATWGGRKGEQDVELKDGETTTVHITLK